MTREFWIIADAGAAPGTDSLLIRSTGARPSFWHGNDVNLNFVAVDKHGDPIDLTALDTIELRIKSSQTSSTNLIAVVDEAADNDTVAKSDLKGEIAGTAHLVVPLTSAEISVDMEGNPSRKGWAVLTGIEGTEERTLGAGWVTFFEDNNSVGVAAPADPELYALESGIVHYDPAIVALTGGGATKLDGIVTAGVSVGRAQGVKGSLFGVWILTAGTDAENGDTVIRPDDYATTTNEKIWQLVSLSVEQIVVYNGGTIFGTISLFDGFSAGGKSTLSAGMLADKEVEFTPGTLTDGATISWDVSGEGNLAKVTLAGNRTLTKPTGITSGKAATLILEITQDGTGSRTLAYAAGIEWTGGSAPVLSTAIDAVDILTLVTFDGGTTWRGALQKGFS